MVQCIPGQSHPIRTGSLLLAKSAPSGTDVVFTRFLGDISVLIDQRRYIENQIIHNGYEPWMIDLIERFVPSRDSVSIDVGANVGLISFMIGKQAGPSGKVISAEPSAPFFERLCKNLEMNPTISKIITPINVGVGAEVGQLFWFEDPAQPGNGLLRESGGLPVAVTTIDNIARDYALSRLDFVKIDVEGMEHEILKGGQATWKNLRPVIMFETLPTTPAERGYPVYEAIANEFTALNYQLYSVSLDGKLSIANVNDLTHNSILVPCEKARGFNLDV